MLELTPEKIADFRIAIDNKVEEALVEFDNDLKMVVDRISPEGWTLPSDAGIFMIKRLANADEIKDVNAFLEWYYTVEENFHVKYMVNFINNSPIKTGTKKLFLECWEAFQNNLYALCATGLLAVIEGILSEYSVDKKDVHMMKVCQKKVDEFPEDGSIILRYMWISYNVFIRNLYKKSDFSTGEPNEINRHWLLHGRSAFEISKLDCIRLIGAVESICTIYKTDHEE